MALLSYDEEIARATSRWPFSNGYEFESWSSIWCEECVHFDTCPLLSVILTGRTPASWEDRDPAALNRYTCLEFSRKDSDEAAPVADQSGEPNPMLRRSTPSKEDQ